MNFIAPSVRNRSFNQLSVAIKLLYMQEVVESHIAQAQRCIDNFQSSFVELYGSDSQAYNFHSLRHLSDQVRRFGPLWRCSLFGFESANNILLKSVVGSLKSLSHVVDNFYMRKRTLKSTNEDKGATDSLFTSVPNECAEYALREFGPGVFQSRHTITHTKERIASLSYTRIGDNWYVMLAYNH